VTTPLEVLAVFTGGGAGAVARFAAGRFAAPFAPPAGFHWPTFAINVASSALLGVLVAQCKDRPTLLLFLGIGVCGGFTTFSTFSVETVRLLEGHRPDLALLYAGSSVVVAVGAAYLAMLAFGTK